MRYIIHLLPEERQRLALDALRMRLAAVIGPNKALDYPTTHVTLIWNLEDDPSLPAPISQAALAALLDDVGGAGPLTLPVAAGPETVEGHLLLPLTDSPALASARARLAAGARAVVVADGPAVSRAGEVREQTWPHLTLAQEIERPRWQRGLAWLQAEAGPALQEPIVGVALALVARDVAAGQPYRIVHQVAL